MARGAAEAILDAGLTGKVFAASGLIGSKANITDIKTGRIGFMVGVPLVFYSDEVVIVMVNLLNGKPYAKKVIIPAKSSRPSTSAHPARSSGELQPFLR